MRETLRIFIGWDAKEAIAYDVLKYSIERRATISVDIRPLMRHTLSDVYTRPRGPTESTDFSMTRFLVPYLSGYRGHALFMDCDMLMRADIAELLDVVDLAERRAVWVCQHDYTPSTTVKFLNQPQSIYPRKNWSSFMLFDCHASQGLSPEYVNMAPGLDLHRFHWTGDDWIGSIPLTWNHLVGEYANDETAKNLHYTLGTPCLPGYEASPMAELWHVEHGAMHADARFAMRR